MKPIRMVDLSGQYEKIKPEIDKNVLDVISSTAYINGPEVQEFKKDLGRYLGVNHVISCGNGTDALQAALMVLDLKPGDEVITPDFTFAATVEMIYLLGLNTVFVDVDKNNFNLLPDRIREAITPKTKAIIPVHLYGQCAPMEEILDIAKEFDLKIIEDAAQAIGAEYKFSDGTVKKAGTIGDMGTTSFFPSKNLGAYGDGGAIFTNDDNLARKLTAVVNHGMYERYYHKEVGLNSRLDSLQATILRAKLPHLDEYNRLRNEAANYYDKAFADVAELEIPARSEYSSHVFHQYTLKVKNGKRDELKKHLESQNIPSMIYYPVPLRKQEAYDKQNYIDSNFPNTDELINEVISLPMHTELDTEQLQFIASQVKNFFQ